MAKEQNLSLNPTKISGVCGRLMCCLKNEQETYEYLNSRLPNVGDRVFTSTGTEGVVQSVSVLRQKVKLVVEEEDEKELIEVGVDELDFRPRKKDVKISAKELEELESITDDHEQAAEAPRDSYRDREHKDRKNNKNHRPHKNRGKERGKDRTERGDRTRPAEEKK
jgi:hypothetical protein